LSRTSRPELSNNLEVTDGIGQTIVTRRLRHASNLEAGHEQRDLPRRYALDVKNARPDLADAPMVYEWRAVLRTSLISD
jgi:hypothetical protein